MPTYDYKCKKCNKTFEIFQRFSEEKLKQCENCKEDTLELIISGGLGFSVVGNYTTSRGGTYVPMDSPEQKFEQRMKEL